MHPNMNATIRRLTNVFIILFLLISGIAGYVQIGNRAFFGGPVLAQGAYAPRACPPFDAPVRGTIFDRNGVRLAWSEPDPTAPCGYRRKYADPTLAPLIGYFSYRYGTDGVERSYNDQLAGIFNGADIQGMVNKLLHKPSAGQDVYLTIDERLQQAANRYYDASAIYSNGVCQTPGTSPPGSLIVQDPRNGEILAMVSRPYYDPNRVDDPAYWAQLQADPQAPLLNHATQALYVPGSIFKIPTLIAALDTGKASLSKQYTYDQATTFNAQGFKVNWVDYLDKGQWRDVVRFPMTLEQAFAYSDNTVFAREAVGVGADTWLSYLRKFGIATPGVPVQPVAFDAPFNQSRAYNPGTTGSPASFTITDLATSGFGQGQLLISPLTMSNILSAVAENGVLNEPHVGLKVVPHGVDPASVQPVPVVQHGGGPLFRPETATAVRKALWAVTSYGTADTVVRNGTRLRFSNVHQGGKTGTGEVTSSTVQTWWTAIAPDDQAPNSSPAKLVISLTKENAGEGACQVFVAEDTFNFAFSNGIVK